MTTNNQATGRPQLYRGIVGFALSLLIPSTAVVQRYLGIAGLAGYVFAASVALLLFVKVRHPLARFASSVTRRQVLWLAALTFLLVLIAFALVYPVADSGVLGGGSDNDDAVDIATTELLNGRYPYYPKTYLGNPISQLPGALVLAIPFVILGDSAYQNLFWLFIFFIALKAYSRDSRLALLLLWAVLGCSPVVLYHIVVGSDHLANALYVLLAVLWLVSAVSEPGLESWKRALPAIFLGIALSSRVNFLLLLPLVFSALAKNAGWKPAMRYIAVTLITFGAITVPFYVYDPQGFSPLHTIDKLDQFESVLPLAGLLLPLASGIIALVLAFLQPACGKLDTLLRNCAIVLAFPVLCGIILFSFGTGRPNLVFASYGTFFLFFGAVAFWRGLFAGTALEVA